MKTLRLIQSPTTASALRKQRHHSDSHFASRRRTFVGNFVENFVESGPTPTKSCARCQNEYRWRHQLPTPNSAFTLVEVIISTALMSLILVSGYLCLQASISSQKLVEPRVEVFQNARVALDLISADLRNACPLSREYEFLGMSRILEGIQADNLDFGTHHYTPRRPGEGDFCQVSYFVNKDAETGLFSLWRRRHPGIGLDPLTGGRQEEIARGLLGIQFDYYDGYEWFSEWGQLETPSRQQNSELSPPNLSGMPEAVRITLLMDPNPREQSPDAAEERVTEPPLVFQTVARLNLAGMARQSGSGSSSSGTAAGNEAEQPPNAGEGGNN